MFAAAGSAPACVVVVLQSYATATNLRYHERAGGDRADTQNFQEPYPVEGRGRGGRLRD